MISIIARILPGHYSRVLNISDIVIIRSVENIRSTSLPEVDQSEAKRQRTETAYDTNTVVFMNFRDISLTLPTTKNAVMVERNPRTNITLNIGFSLGFLLFLHHIVSRWNSSYVKDCHTAI